MRFKLMASQHEQADKSKPINDPEGKFTGRYERKKFNAGEIVESDTDLVSRFGPEKFERVDDPSEDKKRIAQLEAELAAVKARVRGNFTPGQPTRENLEGSPAVTPGGDVTTGYQASVGGGKSGPMPADMVKEQLDKNLQEAGQPTPTQQSGEKKGQPPASIKGQPAPRSEKEYHSQLDQMTVQELRDHADEQEIDLKGARNKDDILKAIKSSQSSRG